MERAEWLCPICGDVRSFEQPPCIDGHGADCPDYICTKCGSAVFAGAVHCW